MKKILYLLVLICVLTCVMSACLPYKDTIKGSLCESENNKIIDSGKYYCIYNVNVTQVCYEIYDASGKIALSEITDRPLKINMLNDDLVDIEIGMGTGITIHRYYDVDENVFSRDFTYVLSNSNKIIAYINVPKEKSYENRKVIVQNIFNQDLFYKEFHLDFSNIDTPVIEATFSNDRTSLYLTYLSGEEETKVSTVLNLLH